jgi:hypothetical protein
MKRNLDPFELRLLLAAAIAVVLLIIGMGIG